MSVTAIFGMSRQSYNLPDSSDDCSLDEAMKQGGEERTFDGPATRRDLLTYPTSQGRATGSENKLSDINEG